MDLLMKGWCICLGLNMITLLGGPDWDLIYKALLRPGDILRGPTIPGTNRCGAAATAPTAIACESRAAICGESLLGPIIMGGDYLLGPIIMGGGGDRDLCVAAILAM